MALTESNEQTLIWQIAYLNGLLLQNKEATCKDKNFGSLSNKLQVIETLNVYEIIEGDSMKMYFNKNLFLVEK